MRGLVVGQRPPPSVESTDGRLSVDRTAVRPVAPSMLRTSLEYEFVPGSKPKMVAPPRPASASKKVRTCEMSPPTVLYGAPRHRPGRSYSAAVGAESSPQSVRAGRTKP